MLLTMEVVDEYKKVDCKSYVKCLHAAVKANWGQFHCQDCRAYEAIPIDDPTNAFFARLGRKILDRAGR